MKLVSSIVTVAILSAILPAQAQDRARVASPPAAPLATTDPLQAIYRVSGLRDNGGAINTGQATSFHCTNFSNVPQNIKYVLRNYDSTIVADVTVTVASRRTHTASTHGTVLFNEDVFLSTGKLIEQGSAVIQSTSLLVHCSAMLMDAAAAVPQGIALHLVRVNPAPKTQE